jgi:hypothetical protein
VIYSNETDLGNKNNFKEGIMKAVHRSVSFVLVLILFLAAELPAKLIFEKSEYAARRARLMDKIPDGFAVILGAQSVVG